MTGQLSSVQRLGALNAIFVALRPHQWTKNLVLAAGILFAGHVGEGERWLEVGIAFCAYCALSSAAYLVNDVRDAERDRRHPTKRLRPVARGDVSSTHALRVAVGLALVGLALVAALGVRSLALALVFVAGQLAYSLALKRIYLADAFAIAGLFVVRAAAGAAAVHVHISNWLLVCTASLALFLAFAKRRGEALLVATEPSQGRAVLRHYSLARLGPLVWASAVSTGVAYGLYTAFGPEPLELVPTIPLVVFGLGRYLFLMLRHDLGEEPDRVLLTDPALLLCVFLWAVAAGVALSA